MKLRLTVLVIIGFSWVLPAQSAALMDGILESSAVTAGQVAYLVLVGSGQLAEKSTPEQSFELLRDLAWAPWLRNPEKPVTEADYAWILSRAWRVKGGLLYTLVPGPRYAFREFQFQGWISSSDDPGAVMAGNQALRILGKVMDAHAGQGGQK